MFMAFQQIHLLKENVASAHAVLECTQDLLVVQDNEAREERMKLEGTLTDETAQRQLCGI